MDQLTDLEIQCLGDYLEAHSQSTVKMTITRLHGFLSAIISAPVFIQPVDWLCYVLGEGQAAVDALRVSEMQLLMRFYNQINFEIDGGNGLYFSPYLRHDNNVIPCDENAPDELVIKWSEGYVDGCRYHREWHNAATSHHTTDELKLLMMPILLLVKDQNMMNALQVSDQSLEEDMPELKEQLGKCIFLLHQFWARYRDENNIVDDEDTGLSSTYFHPQEKIGRNDPCSCGSGKKYKKCCLERVYH